MSCKDDKQIRDALARIEGQVRGIRRMIDEDKPATEVLAQIAAVRGALHRVGAQVLEHHLEECLTAVARGRRSELAAEVVDLFARFAK